MKKIIYASCLLVSAAFSYSQTTAANFNSTDCSGSNHDLFSELDAGKVVVIVWVMPCAACINGALTTQTEVQNARALHPGRIVYYLCDDNGGTNCTTLSSWAAINGITDATILSDSKVNMNPYGEPGMPKVIVIGGSQHTVFYNQNEPDVSATGIRAGINSALAAPLGLATNYITNFSLRVYPNPSGSGTKLSGSLHQKAHVTIDILNYLGQKVATVYKGELLAGEFSFDLSVFDLAAGNYFVNFSDGGKSSLAGFILHE